VWAALVATTQASAAVELGLGQIGRQVPVHAELLVARPVEPRGNDAPRFLARTAQPVRERAIGA